MAPMAPPSKTASRPLPWVRALGRTLSGLLVLAALVLGWFVYRVYYANPRTDDAYVHANTAAVAAHVSGQILQLPIKDNQRVKKGDLLFVVDPRPYKLALDTAWTKLRLTEIEIKTLHDTIKAAEAELAQRKVDAANVKQYLDRIIPLRERDFVTDNDVVEAHNKLKAAQAGVAAAASDLQKAQDALGVLGDVNQRIRAAQEAIADAQLNYDYSFVRAPFDGYVTNLNIAEGQYANAGQPVLVLIDDSNWYVLAYFREDLLDRIRPGMLADVALVSYPEQVFQGKVEGIGWGLYQSNGASVAGLPNVEETLNWVRLNQRFPVRISLKSADPERPFRMGQTAVVTVRGR
jgi:membrane fusion protein, multidrug efflux system